MNSLLHLDIYYLRYRYTMLVAKGFRLSWQQTAGKHPVSQIVSC